MKALNKKTNYIWYQRPAERWKECIPIGSGRLGGMIYGNVSEERVCLNEESIWAGGRQDMNNPKAQEALPKLRRLIFEGQIEEAAKLANECFISVPPRFGAYQPYADLMIQESDVTVAGGDVPLKYCEYKNYRRSLELCQGIARVEYEKDGICFQREYFASHVDNVVVIHYSNKGKVPVDYKVQFFRDGENCCRIYSDDAVFYEDHLENDGIKYCGVAKVVVENGKGETNRWASEIMGFAEPAFDIMQADAFTVYVAITTNFRNGNEKECIRQVELAAEKGYEQVKADHIRDFSGLYERFSLELDAPEEELCPISQWLDEVRRGHVTPAFTELYMNYTRYLLISASRKGGLPSNLQGVWNEKKHPGCESDYHTNINMQMNYWPAQAWGLGECEDTLISWLENLTETGKIAAEKTYQAGGWIVHHCSDIFGYAAPNFDVVGLWPMGGPWMCRHLYEMWQYQGNYETMRDRLYPIVRGSVEFILDFLVEAPEGSACPGMLVTNPSVSPENEYLLPEGTHSMLTYGCTMDMEIIRDLFNSCLDMQQEMRRCGDGADHELENRIKEVLSRLPVVKISQRHGGIQEWIEDYEEYDPGHRHISQLYGVYPGKTISREKTPELAAAALRTIERKYEAGYDGQGWSYAWMAAVQARLGNAQGAYEAIEDDYRRHILPNLMINAHGTPQVGDSMGVPAAVLEMLAQSHDGCIELLPALPTAWPEGNIAGMCLRGGHTLDMSWAEGKLLSAVIRHRENAWKMPVRIKEPELYEIVDAQDKTVIKIK